MKIAEADILLVPDLGRVSEEDWVSRWAAKMANAELVMPITPEEPDLAEWLGHLKLAVAGATRPVILVGHGLGCLLIAHAAAGLGDSVKAAFFVCPADIDALEGLPGGVSDGFRPVPRTPLIWPSQAIISRSDPWSGYDLSSALATGWGSKVIDAGDANRINAASGQGPWPEGLTAFALFMKSLT